MIIPELMQKYYNSQNIHFVELVKEWLIKNVAKHQYQVLIDKLEKNRKSENNIKDCDYDDHKSLGIWSQLYAKEYIGIVINHNQELQVQEIISNDTYKYSYDIKSLTLEKLQEAIEGFYKDSSK